MKDLQQVVAELASSKGWTNPLNTPPPEALPTRDPWPSATRVAAKDMPLLTELVAEDQAALEAALQGAWKPVRARGQSLQEERASSIAALRRNSLHLQEVTGRHNQAEGLEVLHIALDGSTRRELLRDAGPSAQDDTVPMTRVANPLEGLSKALQAWPWVQRRFVVYAHACLAEATDQTPCPHTMTAYWVLAEMTGVCEKTVQRDWSPQAPWANTVRQFFDSRPCYGEYVTFKTGEVTPTITATILRFFPRGRHSEQAKVKRWAQRDLADDATKGHTKPSRAGFLERHNQQPNPMSVYTSAKTQISENHWFCVGLESLSQKEDSNKALTLYADIPARVLPLVLREELGLVSLVQGRKGVRAARAKWVARASHALAKAVGDAGNVGCWRALLWAALRCDLYASSGFGLEVVLRLFGVALEVGLEGWALRPVAVAMGVMRHEVQALMRDHGRGLGVVGPRKEGWLEA